MSVKYVQVVLNIHHLELRTEADFNALMDQIETSIRTVHPDLWFDSDVEIDRDTYSKAGDYDE